MRIKNSQIKFSEKHLSKVVPLCFVVLSWIAFELSGLSATFVTNQVILRFIRDGVMVLALIIPIVAGLGINFAITLGAMLTQGIMICLVSLNIVGTKGLILTMILSIGLSIILGQLIGWVLNRVKGKEMITTIILGFLGNSVYQLIFLVGFGTVIPVKNQEILLTRGIGVRNMIDLKGFRNTLDKIGLVEINSIKIPLFMIFVVLIFAFLVYYIFKTPFGQRLKAVGESEHRAEMLGISVSKVRVQAIVLSTMIASLGQLFFVQNIGMLNVYTGHLKTDIFSSAALLAGGASIKSAKVRHAIIGIFLFHTLFIVSPQAGQNLFNNAALGEYFRSFVAYGTIAFALIMNMKARPDEKIHDIM